MAKTLRKSLITLCWRLSLCSSLAAQARSPDIGCVYPAGARQGESLEVTVQGQQLAKATSARISGQGVGVRVVKFHRPLPPQRFQEFREALADHRKSMMGKKIKAGKLEAIAPILQEVGATEDEIVTFLQMQDQKSDPKRQANKQLEEWVTLQIDVDKSAPVGSRSLRLYGQGGISNPLTFQIGELPEVCESPDGPVLRFPVTVNGRIFPGETDTYSFHASKGDHLIFAGETRSLIPYLADAVPGWFQMALQIRDASGRPLMETQSFRFSPEPVLVFEVPQSGDYRLEVSDALHRGRDDFIYRITAGKIPFVTGTVPLGAPCGTQADIRILGWNLPSEHISLTVPTAPGLYRGLVAHAFSFVAGEANENQAVEPDDDMGHVPRVRVPTTINGVIDHPGDVDGFAIKATRSVPLVIEVAARRLGSPLDSFLRVTDSGGREIAHNDDQEDPGSGLLTHHADSRILFEPPDDGLFFIWISDAQHAGGADFPYRLRMAPTRPDFELRATPSAVSGPPGSKVPLTLHVERKEGFDGAIQLRCATPGFALSDAVVPGDADTLDTTLLLPRRSESPIQPVIITGHADANGKTLDHEAVPADDMLQAFIYHHLVTTDEFLVHLRPGKGTPSQQRMLRPSPLKTRTPKTEKNRGRH